MLLTCAHTLTFLTGVCAKCRAECSGLWSGCTVTDCCSQALASLSINFLLEASCLSGSAEVRACCSNSSQQALSWKTGSPPLVELLSRLSYGIYRDMLENRAASWLRSFRFCRHQVKLLVVLSYMFQGKVERILMCSHSHNLSRCDLACPPWPPM